MSVSALIFERAKTRAESPVEIKARRCADFLFLHLEEAGTVVESGTIFESPRYDDAA